MNSRQKAILLLLSSSWGKTEVRQGGPNLKRDTLMITLDVIFEKSTPTPMFNGHTTCIHKPSLKYFKLLMDKGFLHRNIIINLYHAIYLATAVYISLSALNPRL
uniref:Uncharacterized protein n=1 Tax=Glossina brevipalpis TaxID=37001 RepID=A0A1A9VZN9_9MUSC